MAVQPNLWGRLLCLLEGEVSANTLEAYRRAGGAVSDLLAHVEDRRLEMRVEDVAPNDATQAHFLCAWCAFALQTLGDQFLDADYRASPATIGYVPPVTGEQVLAFYAQVEPWLSRANQAASNPEYRLDIEVPAVLPPWSVVEPCPRPHLEAMRAATASLRTHAESALATMPVGDRPQDSVHRLRQLAAAAASKADYVERLYSDVVSQSLHEQIERHAKDAVEGYYRLGQILAMPRLIEAPTPPQTIGAASHPPTSAPGEPGFDPWCLTDPATRADWQRDPRARQAIEALWEQDPDPRRTLAIRGEIDAALSRGDIADMNESGGKGASCYFCCPWSAIFVVKRPVTIGGKRLRSLQQFTYDVSAEEMLSGGAFKREIMVGVFQPTDKVDYCDPQSGGHDDD